MSKIKSETAVAEVVKTEQANSNEIAALNGATSTAVAVRPTMCVGAFDLGDDTGSGSAARPAATLHISHNLSEKEPEGCVKGSVWLARKSDVTWPCKVADLGKSIRFIPFSIMHTWREITEYGSGAIPREFATKADADAAGLITDFQPAGSGQYRNCAPMYKLWVLIEAPEGVKDEGFFYLNLDGKFYAPAEMYVDKYKSYVSLKTVLQSAATILSAKFCKPVNEVDISAITLSMRTEFRDVKVQSNVRKIPYMFFDTSKDANGTIMFTSDKFREDLKTTLASMTPTNLEDNIDF